MQINIIVNEAVIYNQLPTQAEIDAAYAVRIFLQHHPGIPMTLPALIWQSGVAEPRLKAAFQHQFQERLEEYWERMRVR
ncbi:MAG TPA: hypothetical protein VGS79_13845 [Puia sp.]|nr:hypothetical protein [Puia sp.]